METARRNDGESGSTLEPQQDDLSTANELFDLAVDALGVAEDVDSVTEKNRLIRAARALVEASRGKVNDLGRGDSWRRLGEVMRRVVR
jgi:hypothetical protein